VLELVDEGTSSAFSLVATDVVHQFVDERQVELYGSGERYLDWSAVLQESGNTTADGSRPHIE